MCRFEGMKENAIVSNQQSSETKRRDHALTFAKVLDGRKQPIRGLWIRGSRYYARLSVETPITGVNKTRRVPLVDKEGNADNSTGRGGIETVTNAAFG